MRGARRIELPLYLVVLLLAALALNLIRGFDLARRHNARLQPDRVSTLVDLRGAAGEENADGAEARSLTIGPEQRFLIVALPEEAGSTRLALHQIYPERDLLRWLEEGNPSEDWLVVPLAGLPPGSYAFRWAEVEERAEANNPDWEQPERHWFGHFRLERE